MAARSTQLYAGDISSTGEHLLFTVPDGKVCIWKSAVVYSAYASAQRIYFTIDNGSSNLAYIPVYCGATGSAGDVQIVPLWIVLAEGQRIQVTPAHTEITVVLSGALLDLV